LLCRQGLGLTDKDGQLDNELDLVRLTHQVTVHVNRLRRQRDRQFMPALLDERPARLNGRGDDFCQFDPRFAEFQLVAREAAAPAIHRP
jgi:hypothetical protein